MLIEPKLVKIGEAARLLGTTSDTLTGPEIEEQARQLSLV